jgi:pyruvate dehydrogenase E2 component (dihydrolipoamide acetyltransferase)
MATNEIMPKFGLSMEEGVVSEWLVPIGGAIKRGDPIAVIEAEKLTNDAVASVDGVMLKYFLEPGDSAPCGNPICAIGEAGEIIADEPFDDKAKAEPVKPPATAAPELEAVVFATPRAQAVMQQRVVNAATISGTGQSGEITIDDVRASIINASETQAPEETVCSSVSITPRARMLAEKLHLSYAHIRGTGLLGMITVADVKTHGKHAAQAKIVPMNAVAMKRSLDNTAQTTVSIETGFGPLVSAYKRLKPAYAAEGVKLSYTAMIVYAVSRALATHEDIRMQYYDEKNFILPQGVHVGVAIDTERGLIVPAVRNADQKTLRELCRDILDLAACAKSGRLTESDFGGAATTVTNLAMAGATSFTPILNPPESTILGVCKLRDMPVAKDGGVFIEPVMNLCLTYDHRVINGAPACRYLQSVVDILNETDWR